MSNPLGLTYCEETLQGLIAQPFNTISNIAFLIVALLLWRLYKKKYKGGSPVMPWLVLSPIVIFVFSSIWHASQVGWTLWLDIAGIAIFAILYLAQTIRFELNKGWGAFIVATLIIAGFSAISTHYLGDLIPQRSAGFLPLLALFAAVTIYAVTKSQLKLAKYFGWATLVFAFALVMRVSDIAFCDVTHHGTHDLWHILSAVTAYLLVRPLYLK